jgi:hypothetical protein
MDSESTVAEGVHAEFSSLALDNPQEGTISNLLTFRQAPQAFQPVLITESSNQLDSESEALCYTGRLSRPLSEADPKAVAEPKPADDTGGMDIEMNREERDLRENM